MRKLILFACIVLTSFAINAQKKVAVVTFYLNKNIGSGDLGENAAFLKDILTLAENPNFDLNPVLDKFYTNFKEDLAKDFPFELLPEEEVINNEQYQAFQNNGDSLGNVFLLPEGYKQLWRPTLGLYQKDKNAMIDIFKDKVDGIMFVMLYFEFQKTTIMGVGQAKIQAVYNILCYNTDGKKVFDIYRRAPSKKGVPVAGGYPIMKLEKIQPMCDSAAEELIKDVQSKLPKIVKKAGKKL